jgi:hypothetical protein
MNHLTGKMTMGGALLALSLCGLACGGSDAYARAPTETELTAADAPTETDELCSRVRTSVEVASAELIALEDTAAGAPWAERQKMERGIAEARWKLLVVRRAARRIPSQYGPVWPSFKVEIARAIEDLQRAVRTASEVQVASE